MRPPEFAGPADVVIDFSNPAALARLLSYCIRRRLPVILCTTGYGPEHLEAIRKASEQIPVFKSGNMSVGINLLTVLLKKAAAVLGENFDVEIVERHHRTKLDAPSGTALMLADAAAPPCPSNPSMSMT
jgi:4-hydroxy-tetrahydrodipicolinate reductase